jgi:hypothetical protein
MSHPCIINKLTNCTYTNHQTHNIIFDLTLMITKMIHDLKNVCKQNATKDVI